MGEKSTFLRKMRMPKNIGNLTLPLMSMWRHHIAQRTKTLSSTISYFKQKTAIIFKCENNRRFSYSIGISKQCCKGRSFTGFSGVAGFTLIELLVVISIISLLSSVVLGTLSDARAKARDAARTRTVEEYRKAFLMYYDKYGAFPDPGSTSSCIGDADGDGKCGFNDNTSESTVVAEFIQGPPSIESVNWGSGTIEGLQYNCSIGGGTQCTVYWGLEQDATCPGGTPVVGTLCRATWQ